MVSNGGLLSHVKIAVRSTDAADLAYLDQVIERYCAAGSAPATSGDQLRRQPTPAPRPRRRNKAHYSKLVITHQGEGQAKFDSHYDSLDRGRIYVKIDDDIVFIRWAASRWRAAATYPGGSFAAARAVAELANQPPACWHLQAQRHRAAGQGEVGAQPLPVCVRQRHRPLHPLLRAQQDGWAARPCAPGSCLAKTPALSLSLAQHPPPTRCGRPQGAGLLPACRRPARSGRPEPQLRRPSPHRQKGGRAVHRGGVHQGEDGPGVRLQPLLQLHLEQHRLHRHLAQQVDRRAARRS